MLTKSLPNNSNLTSIKNDNNNTLLYYANIYFNIIVSGSSKATELARKNDFVMRQAKQPTKVNLAPN